MALNPLFPKSSDAGVYATEMTSFGDENGNNKGSREERSMEHDHPHDDYYRHLKGDSARAMKHLCGFRLEPTCRDDVRECVMEALGISLEEAETLFAAIEWLHACHELKEQN